MKLLFALCLLRLGLAQTPADHADLTADKVSRTDNLLRGTGHARAKIGGLVLQADEATLRSDTGELELRGHVHGTLPARDDHTLVRYGTGALATTSPVDLHADRLIVKDGRLSAFGNIVIRSLDPETPDAAPIQGDEMVMDLKIADATLRGNVHTKIKMPSSVVPGMARQPIFPPEIEIKK